MLCGVNGAAALDFLGTLLKFYGDYRTQKEREAYAAIVLYLGATGAVLSSTTLHNRLVLVGVAGATLLVAALVFWQVRNLWLAARVISACISVTAAWLHAEPTPAQLLPTELRGFRVKMPADVAADFHTRDNPSLTGARYVLPSLILAWGLAVVVRLWC
jgi:hypothetical protein